MISFNLSGFTSTNSTGILTEKDITVQAAVEVSGYNIQYLRRLLCAGTLEGIKIGQVWLISLASFESYIQRAMKTSDKRFGVIICTGNHAAIREMLRVTFP
jgi:hypothetical protein